MGEKSIKHKFRNSLLFLIIVSIAVLCYAHLNENYRLGFATYVQPSWIYLFILVMFAIVFIRKIKTDVVFPPLLLYSVALSVSMAFSALINMTETEVTIGVIVLYSFSWMSVLFLSYFLKKSSRGHAGESKSIYFLIAITIFLSYFNMENVSSGSRIAINSIYWLVLCLPLILKLKARAIRYLGILFVLVATAVSLKRTAFIAVSFGLITYAIIKHFLNIRAKRNSIISVIIIIAISAIAIYSYDVVSEKYHFDLQQRFQSLLIDGGSGRDAIYKGVIDLQLKSSVFDWVFGHGQGAVASKSPDELTAHDDFLEVLYDYGIIGLLLYVGIYIQLVRQLMRMLSNTSDLAAPFAASIMMFIVISLFSHLLIYPTYFYLLCLFWGISIAEYEISQKQMAGLYEIGLKQEGL